MLILPLYHLTQNKQGANVNIERRCEVKKILIVEDDKNLRNLLKDILIRHYLVSTASNAKDALGVIMSTRSFAFADFNLVISDIEMPIMHGWRLLEEVREKFPELPVILMSGEHAYEKEALGRGAVAFIKKPFHLKELECAVKASLK